MSEELHDRNISPDKPGIGAHPAPCPVVGVGASAGGLEAFQNLLAAVPADSGYAYVLVQHLDPNHESMLAELLSRRTEMQVRQVSDGMPIEPNNVYLIPPNASLIVEKAELRLSDFSEPRGFRRPIDVFFRSLAIDQGPNAACVVLSGTGGDGSEGLRAVKEAGGLTIVQEPETAKYDGMPKNAVATGLVDKVLRVDEMPAAIRDYFDRGQESLKLPDIDDFLSQVCEEVRSRLGHDFSQYKSSTMLRRVQRRMQVVGASNGADYIALLKEGSEEPELLFRDLLINVTCFFRDAEAFDFLRREVIPGILKGKGASDTVRIWTPGCSSGEEAYSLAILIAEVLSREKEHPHVQIFATDIDEPMLQKARAARYPHSAVREVPIELLDRYFYSNEDDYVLSQPIRDMVRVSNHNLIKDPPFSRCDLIVCRNLLIYLNSNLQQRLIPVFHYALKKDGWLFLGSAENIATRNDLFETVELSAKIYRRRGSSRQSVTMPLQVHPHTTRPVRPELNQVEQSEEIARRVLERYAPAHVVVDSGNSVTYVSSRTGKYLEFAPGAPSNRIVDLTRRGLRSAVRSVLDTARRTGQRTVKHDVRMDGDEEAVLVDVCAERLSNGHLLLVFRDAPGGARELDGDLEANADGYSDDQRIKELEDELGETKTKLRTTVEELETSNEELKSSNEEMMSMNEELQSTNEELATVNEELKNKVDQLGNANSDLQNFIESTQIPTIFLDKKLRIRSFTPAVRRLFRFQEQDKGRLFSDVVSRADLKQLESLTRRVLDSGQVVEEELAVDEGTEQFVLRALPYRNVSQTIDGVILVFNDVTKIRQAQFELAKNIEIARRSSHEIETLYQTATVGMALVDRNRRFLKINQLFADLNGATIEDHLGRSLDVMTPRLAERLSRPIEEVFETGKSVPDLDVSLRVEEDEYRDFLVDSYPYLEDDRVTAVGIIVKDVTEVRVLERELRRLMDELQHRVKNTLATVSSVINQTASSGKVVPDIIDTLRRRVGALAATHHLLTSKDWREVSLMDILNTELRPFDHRDRIEMSGPPVALPPKHALTLTMTFHELATNAAKYGAIAHESGRLRVEWAIMLTASGRQLTISWWETGVPIEKTENTRQSFGTRLIKNAVAHDLGGKCTYTLEQDGVKCTLEVPF
ncbi:chemotaxis protein CheB [Hyphomicrobium sp.]|uniref:chemotaxis protein CheB n=1 Tax=Hyphomicrobium sp. TaxID=82 RepID=UPI0025BD1D88|nr:chemotaxis protein CheB [Hyphomicrobium sp.]